MGPLTDKVALVTGASRGIGKGIAIALGRQGVYRPAWTIDEVAENIDTIRDTDNQWILSPVPSGYADHLRRSFAMARREL